MAARPSGQIRNYFLISHEWCLPIQEDIWWWSWHLRAKEGHQAGISTTNSFLQSARHAAVQIGEAPILACFKCLLWMATPSRLLTMGLVRRALLPNLDAQHSFPSMRVWSKTLNWIAWWNWRLHFRKQEMLCNMFIVQQPPDAHLCAILEVISSFLVWKFLMKYMSQYVVSTLFGPLSDAEHW